MVEKKEGAKMTCSKCNTELTCHSKTYPKSEKYEEKTVLQWQNEDGTAHYSTKDGKNFSCNVPDSQAHAEGPQQLPSPNDSKLSLESLNEKMDIQTGILQSILTILVDLKTNQNKHELEEIIADEKKEGEFP